MFHVWGKSSPTETPDAFGDGLWSAYHPSVGSGKAPDDQTDTDRSTSPVNTEPHTACRSTCRTCFGPLWLGIGATILGAVILII